MPKQYAAWGDIPEETIQGFLAAIDKLERDLPINADRDRPFQVRVTDRRKYEPHPWWNVPYYDKQPEKHFEAVFDNLSQAVDKMNTAFRLRKLDAPSKESANQELLVAAHAALTVMPLGQPETRQLREAIAKAKGDEACGA